MTSTNSPIAKSEDPAPRPTRRRFSPEYKLRMVAEYDAAPAGEKGAILRRERLYHSHIMEWRAARDAGAMVTLTDQRTSPARPFWLVDPWVSELVGDARRLSVAVQEALWLRVVAALVAGRTRKDVAAVSQVSLKAVRRPGGRSAGRQARGTRGPAARASGRRIPGSPMRSSSRRSGRPCWIPGPVTRACGVRRVGLQS